MKPLSLVLSLLVTLSLHAATPWRSGGPEGGVARQLVAAPSDPRVVYLASQGGVFRSDDSGTTWRDVSGPIETSHVLAVDPHDPDTVFAARGYDFTSIYKTTDGGSTWVFTGLSGLRASAIVIDPSDSNVVYVGAGCGVIFSRGPRTQAFEGAGVYKSTDGGATFVYSSNGLDGFTRCVTALSLNPLHPETLYTEPIFGDGGSRSDDAGATWQIAKVVQPGRKVLADPRNPDRLYGVGKQGLVISEDRGATWTRKIPRALEGPELFGVEHIAVDPASGRLFTLSGGLYRSGDGGVTFLPIPFAPMEPIYTMAFDPTTGTLIAGTPTSVYVSRGFPWEQWTEVFTGDRSLEMRGIVASLREPGTAYASSRGRVYATRDAGLSWQPLPRPPFADVLSAFIIQLVVDAGENLYARVSGSGTPLFKLPAGSNQWVTLGEGGSGILSVDPRVPGVVYSATTGGFRVTRDGGATWNWIFMPNDWSGFSLAVDPDDSNVLYGVGSGGLAKSVDGGHTWSLKLAESVSLEMAPAVSPADGGQTIYVAVRDLDAEYNISLYRSTDAGETWTRRNFPNGGGVLSLVADPRDARTFYVSMQQDGVYRTTDGGETYQPLQFGLPEHLGWLAVNNTGTVLHATSWKSMWELSLVPGRRRAVR